MKGCIINNEKISIRDIFDCIESADNYNWLISNIECYPVDENILKTLSGEYCWITGKELLNLLYQEDFQWIWGVFSAFPSEILLGEVLDNDLPYADGYTGFWKNPVSVQNPFAKMEIVVWDGTITLAISKEDKVIEDIMKEQVDARDLESYNKE